MANVNKEGRSLRLHEEELTSSLKNEFALCRIKLLPACSVGLMLPALTAGPQIQIDQVASAFPSTPYRRNKGSPHLSLSCSGLEQTLLFKVNLALAYSKES